MGKQKLTLTAALAALALTGCASTLVGANEAGGMISVGLDDGKAFQMANDHCKKFSKVARISQAPNELVPQMVFDCVAP